MTSPWEKAVDVAIAESEGLTTLGAAIVAVSVGLAKFAPNVGSPGDAALAVSAILSVFSAGTGVLFQGAITQSLLDACCDQPAEFVQALRSAPTRALMKAQWALIVLSLLGLLAFPVADSLTSFLPRALQAT